jgi:hypothetical protein
LPVESQACAAFPANNPGAGTLQISEVELPSRGAFELAYLAADERAVLIGGLAQVVEGLEVDPELWRRTEEPAQP